MPAVTGINIKRILDQHNRDSPAAFLHLNILLDPANDGSILQGFDEESL